MHLLCKTLREFTKHVDWYNQLWHTENVYEVAAGCSVKQTQCYMHFAAQWEPQKDGVSRWPSGNGLLGWLWLTVFIRRPPKSHTNYLVYILGHFPFYKKMLDIVGILLMALSRPTFKESAGHNRILLMRSAFTRRQAVTLVFKTFRENCGKITTVNKNR